MEQPLWDTGKGAEHGVVITESLRKDMNIVL